MSNQTTTRPRVNVNLAGLQKSDYRGATSTLCQGCGHNSISSQIIAAAYELDLVPENVVKFSGIGCSSKSPTYFLDRSFGFNGLHGRMPSIATGAMFGDRTLIGLGVSGDGDTASIGMGQFKHVMRRNVPLVYIVENNGVYGLTKGQFSATAETGLSLKNHGTNRYMPTALIHHKPQNELQAKFSMEFCMAALLLYGKAGLNEFTDQVVRRPEVQSMIERVHFGVHPEAEAAGYNKMTTILTLRLKDGRTLNGRADFGKGSPANPMTYDEVAAKFLDCASFAKFSGDKAKKIVEMVRGLEDVSDVRALTALCSG